MIERLNAHYGFTKTPFGKTLAPGMLHHHTSHNQAVARISWCIAQRTIGLVVGESGAGKTVAARAAIAALDQTRHTLIYVANPTTGARGVASATTSSPASAAYPASKTPPCSRKPPTPSPPKTPNAADNPSSRSTKPTSSTTTHWT
jgi:type II secretory pathway predicted ATPase ExeA